MDELLKLSIEELEHVLAIAPYSEMHQMAYAVKKNQHDKGSMYQIMEGNYHLLKVTQDKISKQIISGGLDSSTTQSIEPKDDITPTVISDAAEEPDDSSRVSSEPKDPVLKKTKKKKKKKEGEKTEDKLELIEPKDINLLGDVSSFILPDKTKEKKKRKKKSDKRKKKKNKGSKKKDLKSNEPEQKEDEPSSETERDLSGLSDFSTWLLEQSKESHINPLKEKSKKKKKKKLKLKKKAAKKKKKKNKALVSEPLADLLASQGHKEEAVEMYQKLSLIIPEKSAFFAGKIDKIQKDT